ncbi:hypothetical protein [Sedimenticola selenatireducens]|uniref:hypothetical protein n=1 Tax=Sedimenticola selenatireducens TaxID=191960 RepID=UPI002AAAE716|nr:hypothetical protein [Sedimenticola selenatireducens]
METYDKLEIADQFLDAAINEFLNHGRFLAALNLAAVAEELYGKYVRILQKKDAFQENIENAKIIWQAQGEADLEIKEWKKIANVYKNNIKHFNSEADRFVDIEAEDQARLAIADAMNNREKLERIESDEIKSFTNWAQEYVAKNVHIEGL